MIGLWPDWLIKGRTYEALVPLTSPAGRRELLGVNRKNLALYIRDCESLCLSDETLTAVGPFYLVSIAVFTPTLYNDITATFVTKPLQKACVNTFYF